MKPLIVANWKMNTNLADASVLATLVRNQLGDLENVDAVLCPPFIWLQEVASILEISAEHIHLGAQNCFAESYGPYTGEVSVAMLKDLCKYVIVGHSERRNHFGETSDMVSDKVQAVLSHNMMPIVCVGEKQKSSSSIGQVLTMLRQSLEGVASTDFANVVVAYEPVWSISTVSKGEVATGDYAEEVCHAIKKYVGQNTRVLYGGSVDGKNVTEFIGQPSIDGCLVGGASLKASAFVEVCKKASGRN